MTTLHIKVEISDERALMDALEALVESHGASFYTLMRNGEALAVAEHDAHLREEEEEANAMALASAFTRLLREQRART